MNHDWFSCYSSMTNIQATFLLTNDDDHHTGSSQLLHLPDPLGHRFKRAASCDVVGDNGPVCTAVVALSDSAETLLSRCVPHLHLQQNSEREQLYWATTILNALSQALCSQVRTQLTHQHTQKTNTQFQKLLTHSSFSITVSGTSKAPEKVHNCVT